MVFRLRMGDVDRLSIEVHMLPFQVQDFSLSHSRLQDYDDNRADVSASANENRESRFFSSSVR